MTTLELYNKAGENTRLANHRKAIMRAIKRKGYAEDVYWVKMEAGEIRQEVDYTYTSDEPKDILVVEYKADYYACPATVLYWEHSTPSELAEALEI